MASCVFPIEIPHSHRYAVRLVFKEFERGRLDRALRIGMAMARGLAVRRRPVLQLEDSGGLGAFETAPAILSQVSRA